MIDERLNFKGQAATPERATRVWLITFTDLVALMLAFFVMVFAMSSVKVSKWQNVIDSLSQTLRPSLEETVPAATSTFNIGTVFRRSASDLDYLASILAESFEQHPLLSGGSLARLEDRLVISLPGGTLFASGQSVLTEDGKQALFVLGGVLRNIGNRIAVNGHGGSSVQAPTETGGYSSFWELTTAQAVAVANSLRQSGYTDDIIAFGNAPAPAGGGRFDIIIRPEAGGN